MKLVMDPDSGEAYEVLPSDLAGAEPYSYADYRRAVMSQSREHRAAINGLRDAIDTAAGCEVIYRKELATAVLRLKVAHGSTVAPDLAKGEEAVGKAMEARDIAAGMVDVAKERLRLCQQDRAALSRMGEWSREADPDGWRNPS